ncbi:skeletal muscle/kidney enriched inositol 5-phosphatase [Abortiporus biennis]|nr:skeletal muscle/kidney enriched inositol 5-phosphatase [Abortiporus biennis]
MANSDNRLLVQLASYNTNLQADRGLPQDLVDWLAPTLQVSSFLSRAPRAPDIVAVGFQELLPLHLGLSGLSKAVIESRNELILSQIEQHAPNKERYTLIAKVVNVGVALLVYALDEGVGRKVQDVQTQWTGCGPLYMGNKGAVGVRFRVPSEDGGIGEVFTFVCAHLTAHAQNLQKRVDDYNYIVSSLLFPPVPGSTSKSPTTIYSTSHLFFFGDLNFRLNPIPPTLYSDPSNPRNTIHDLLREDIRHNLREHDQLVIERDVKGTSFVGLREGDFTQFKCTYKYDLGEVDKYDLKRLPAWTDRIMYTTYTDSPDTPQVSTITNALYTSIPSYTTSDHKPIVAVLQLPPPSPSPSESSPPLLHLPSTYNPKPDPLANVKKYIGRTFDRIIGYIWWFLTFFGAGSAVYGIGNFLLSFGLWTWYKSRSASSIQIGSPDSQSV